LNVRSPLVEQAHKFMPYHPPPDLSKFLVAPMPGAICSVAVKEGDVVKVNQELCVIEAMKMQNVLRSHGNLKVKKVNIKTGDVVGDGALLIEFEKTN
jgi:propionyl-CoA carboxylase alpha chain